MQLAERGDGGLGGAPLVLRVAKPPEQADGDRLALDPIELGEQGVLVERPQHAVRAGALRHGHAQVGRHERGRVADAEAVELGAGLAA